MQKWFKTQKIIKNNYFLSLIISNGLSCADLLMVTRGDAPGFPVHRWPFERRALRDKSRLEDKTAHKNNDFETEYSARTDPNSVVKNPRFFYASGLMKFSEIGACRFEHHSLVFAITGFFCHPCFFFVIPAVGQEPVHKEDVCHQHGWALDPGSSPGMTAIGQLGCINFIWPESTGLDNVTDKANAC